MASSEKWKDAHKILFFNEKQQLLAELLHAGHPIILVTGRAPDICAEVVRHTTEQLPTGMYERYFRIPYSSFATYFLEYHTCRALYVYENADRITPRDFALMREHIANTGSQFIIIVKEPWELNAVLRLPSVSMKAWQPGNERYPWLEPSNRDVKPYSCINLREQQFRSREAQKLQYLFDVAARSPEVRQGVEHMAQRFYLEKAQEGLEDFEDVYYNFEFGSESSTQLQHETNIISEVFMEHLAANPDGLFEVSPRNFEIIIGKLYERLGYTVELTPAHKDGGKDILISRVNDVGEVLYLVECKQYAAKKPVTVDVVRNFFGVINTHDPKPTGGIVVTTSHFTKGSLEFVNQSDTTYRMAYCDFNDLRRLFRKAYPPKYFI